MPKMNYAVNLAATIALLLSGGSHAYAQDPKEIVNNPKLFLNIAVKMLKWEVPAEPMKIVGPIHFVGTEGLGMWLITSPQGHILLNTGMGNSGPMVEASIRKLGFDPKDIKLLLACHAHIDHVGGHAYIKKLSGAEVVMSPAEKDLLESGGKIDFHYGQVEEFRFEPVKVDRVVQDGETVKVGDIALTARLTPGHTKGSTTWTMNVVDGGKTYTVVFPDGGGVNPGYHVDKDPSYPGIGDNYRRTFGILQALNPDISLSAHLADFGFAERRARAGQEGVKAWVDSNGYKKWIAGLREKFEAEAKAERAAPAGTK